MERQSKDHGIGGRRRSFHAAPVAAGLIAVGSLLPAPAGAEDDLAAYVDRVADVSAQRNYNSDTDQTTFTFTLELESGTDSVSHIVIAPCPGPATVVSSSGPPGSSGSVADPDPSTEHHGAKFEPGYSARYEVTFDGSPRGAEFIVKNGRGHKHYLRSSCFATVSPTTAPPTTTTTTTAPTQTTTSTTTAGTRPRGTSTTTSGMSDRARLKECERQAKSAEVVYQPKRQMTVGETSQVRVIASVASGEGRTDITLGSSTTVVAVELRCQVEARLRGNDFDVDPEEFQEASFLDRPQIVWSWDVSPKRIGDAVLTLEIKSNAEIDGRTVVGTPHLYSASISVNAKPETFGDKTHRWSNAVVEHPLVKGLAPLLLVLGTVASLWRWFLKRPWPWK